MVKNIYSHRNLLGNANDFKYVALKIIETGQNKIGNKIYGVQYFVNAFFAIELYLKFLIEISNKKIPKKHKLDDLFDEIDDCDKIYLLKKYNNFRNFLEKEANSFETWRYSYEHSMIGASISKTKKVLNILDDYCNKKGVKV